MLKKFIGKKIISKNLISLGIFFILLSLVGCKSLPQQKKNTTALDIEVFPSVYLRRTISRSKIGIGQSFDYLITVRDYSKNARTLSVTPAKITFPGFKLSKQKKIPKKIKNGREIAHVFTFVAQKKGKRKIKAWPVRIKSGKLSKKVTLSAVTINVSSKKVPLAKTSKSLFTLSPSLKTTIYEIAVVFFSFAALIGILYFAVKIGRRFLGRGGRGRRI